MADEMDEIIAEFITEAEESLEKIDPLFVELEVKGYDRELLNDIFRSMHTIKGAAGFLGFRNIVEVSHKSESILKRLRDGELTVTTELMNSILRSVDMLKLLLRHLRLKDGIEEDITPRLKELESAITAGDETGQTEAAAALSPPQEKKTVEADPPPGREESRKEHDEAAEDPEKGMNSPETLSAQHVQSQEATAKAAPPPAQEAPQTLRVDIERVDKVMNLTGEIVLVRNRLLTIANYLDARYADDQNVESLLGTVAFLDLVTSDMQLAVMKMRMQPLKKVFGKFPRLVRDLSNNIGKEVDLILSGEETEVDRSVIEQIGDPMVHIIRNAIDHGFESPEERQETGKPVRGRLVISAYQQGSQIIIDITDDGQGIDLEKVKKKAVERGFISEEEAQRMTDEAATNLILLPGFSTKDVATELSGRGVGMDVVKTNISKLNGYLEVITKKGTGSTFRISIPLTLAIIQALMVRADGAQFAIPLAPIVETLKIRRGDIENVSGQKVLVVREQVSPLFELSEILNLTEGNGSEYRYVLVIAIGERRFCIAVDELLGQEEVVIKTIHGIDTDSSYILGATITGEGKVVLILDPGGISRSFAGAL